MNTHKNGSAVIGAPNSYQYWLSCFKDALKGKGRSKLKDFEAVMFAAKVRKAGEAIGLTLSRMQDDWHDAHRMGEA